MLSAATPAALYERVRKHPKVAEWNAMPGH